MMSIIPLRQTLLASLSTPAIWSKITPIEIHQTKHLGQIFDPYISRWWQGIGAEGMRVDLMKLQSRTHRGRMYESDFVWSKDGSRDAVSGHGIKPCARGGMLIFNNARSRVSDSGYSKLRPPTSPYSLIFFRFLAIKLFFFYMIKFNTFTFCGFVHSLLAHSRGYVKISTTMTS